MLYCSLSLSARGVRGRGGARAGHQVGEEGKEARGGAGRRGGARAGRQVGEEGKEGEVGKEVGKRGKESQEGKERGQNCGGQGGFKVTNDKQKTVER